MLMGPLQNICKVNSLLVQQERQIALPIDDSKLLAFLNGHHQGRGTDIFRGKNTRGGRSFYDWGRGTRICTHYGMTNHTIDTY